MNPKAITAGVRLAARVIEEQHAHTLPWGQWLLSVVAGGIIGTIAYAIIWRRRR